MRVSVLVAGCVVLAGAGAAYVLRPQPAPGPAAPVVVASPAEVAAPAPADRAAPPPEVTKAREQAARAVQAKNYAEARAVLETALALFPGQSVLAQDLVVVLQREAVDALRDGRLAAASRAVARARELSPDEPAVNKVAARVFRAQAGETDDDDNKRALLDQALALDADNGALWQDKAQVCERLNDLPCAVSALESLQKTEQGEHLRGLTDKIARLKQQLSVEGAFRGVESDHFVARFEGYGTEQIAWRALNRLERAYFSINDKLGRKPDQLVTVVIYTGSQYQTALNAPDWSNGLYDGKIRVREGDVLAASDAFDDVLAHEYTHALIAQTVRGHLPGWLHEGLAVVHEPHHVTRDTVLSRAAQSDQLLSLAALGPPLSQIADPTTARLAYEMSESLVRALKDKQGSFGLTKLLDAVNERQDFDAAFREVFYTGPETFYDRWRDAL